MPRNPLPVSSLFIHTVSCKCSGFVSSNYFCAFTCSSIIHVYVLNKKCLDLPGFGLVCKSNHDICILPWHTFLIFFKKTFIHVYAHACISCFHCCIIFHCITVPQFYSLFCLLGLELLFSVFTIEDNAAVDILPICNVNSVFLAVFSVENMIDTGQILNK